MEQLTVRFAVADVDAEERLVRAYVADAIERLAARDDARWPTFNRYGHDPATERGEVVLTVLGDAAAVVERERDRWHALDGEPWVRGVHAESEDVALGELTRVRFRQRHAASRMSLAYLAEFDELPDALDALPDADHDVGFALPLHHVVNQLGYQAGDGEEEIEVLVDALAGRLHATAAAPDDGSVARAEAKIDEVVAALESLRGELRDAHGDG